MNTVKLITNDKLNITEKIKGTGNCKERVTKIYYITISKLQPLEGIMSTNGFVNKTL